ncbi:hypothetical protein [Flavobacterium chungnamense]|uniref:Uncharacterized protein n=1 Tax=Flavobacterium chungnamense TaxID=706182 RepID=A0ABP7V2V3_9FLAO
MNDAILQNEKRINVYNSTDSSLLNQQSIITYVTDSSTSNKASINQTKTRENTSITQSSTEQFYDTYPQFFPDFNNIVVPKKLKRHLGRNIPINLLKRIDPNKEVAVEKCLIIASNLTSTLFSEEKWKSLSSKILNEQVKKGNDNTFIYNYVLDVLKYSTNTTAPVIETKKNSNGVDIYQEGICSKQFKFNNSFSNTGISNYFIKNQDCIIKRRKYIYKKLSIATSNKIGNNLLNLYGSIELPTLKEINKEAKRLIKLNYVTKKGKLLTFLNHRNKEYYSDFENRSFVEENIKTFEYLTNSGFMIPIVGNDKSGGRVFDSFNLMPSWIRKLVKIDGEGIVEIDFCALHPNIAMAIYGGFKKFITHKQIAEESGINIANVKIENLSFFNKKVPQMKKSTLYEYYLNNEPDMVKNIEADKYNSKDSHKATSKKLFKKEVDIMTKCIIELNAKGIYVGYVFDALFCKKSDAKIIAEIMNKIVLENGVFTTAKHEIN